MWVKSYTARVVQIKWQIYGCAVIPWLIIPEKNFFGWGCFITRTPTEIQRFLKKNHHKKNSSIKERIITSFSYRNVNGFIGQKIKRAF